MTIITDTFIPYEYDRQGCLKYIESRCQGLKKALRLIEKDSEHITVRCPLSGDYLDILGSTDELEWLDSMLTRKLLYRTN